MAEIKGVTKGGFAYTLKESVKDDMELVDALAEIDAGNGLAMSTVCLKLLGKEQRKKLYDHVRAEDGTVPIEAVGEAIQDILTGMGTEGKN